MWSFCLTLVMGVSFVAAAEPRGKKETPPPPVPWSFKPLQRVALPKVNDASWPRTRTDHFLLAKMEAAGVKPAPRADARTLLRRLSFDLTGLAPTAAEVADFEKKLATDARGAMREEVDRLLASPHHGERWARHWLDLARYVDQTPDWLESTKYSHLYRDWVVQALNEDLPYDRFIVRQLATDFLPECGPQDLHALGFLGLSPTYFKELQLPPEIIRTTVAEEWEEHVDAVGRTFLGLTIACARCHDHKSDPITTRDYYALAGVFASVRIAERPTLPPDLWAPVAKARDQIATMEKEMVEMKKKKPADLKQKIAEMEGRIARLKETTPHFNVPLANAVEEAALYVVDADNKKGTKLDFKMGMTRDLEVQKRGDPNDLGEVVPRRFLEAFPSKTGRPRRFVTGSGRLELAHALTEEAAPLTARVMANRIWKHHFGRGLVDTPSEFGNTAEPPTHPELLDDLAARFIEHGWSIKWLHREILNSAAWQQSSLAHASEQADPENKLYARMMRRRLDWETWRDAVLAAAGRLDLRLGGPALAVGDEKNLRRSLYGASNRQDMDPMLRIHDVPDPGAHAPWRPETITPLQGLFALNSPFMTGQSEALAARLLAAPQAPVAARVQAACSALYQREPSAREVAAAENFLAGRAEDAAAWAQYAQALLAGNELLFID
jgi:hypothetical protein